MIRWTPAAIADLTEIAKWLAQSDPAAADRVCDAIVAAVLRLRAYPDLGRPGRVPMTRELVVPRRDYVAVYRVQPPGVAVLRILHGAMLWPRNDVPDTD